MPPAAKHNSCVVIYDAAAKDNEEILKGLLKIYCLKHFQASKDLVKLLVTNVEGEDDGVLVYDEIENYNPATLVRVTKDVRPGGGSWIDALGAAVDIFESEEFSDKGLITKQILFATDLNNPLSTPNEKKLSRIIDVMNKLGIYLYIVGPDVTIPQTISKIEDIRPAMRNLILNDVDNANLVKAKEVICSVVNSVMCSVPVGVNLFNFYVNPAGTQAWVVPLTIGTKIEIPIRTYRIMKQVMPTVLKKKRDKYAPVIHVHASNVLQTEEPENVIKGVMRHGKFVPMEGTAPMFKSQEARSYALVGFVVDTDLPEYFLMGDGSYCTVPADFCPGPLTSIIQCLRDQKKYTIIKKVYNKGCKGKFFAMRADDQHNMLVGAPIPYADDIRGQYEEEDPDSLSRVTISKDVQEFLHSITLGHEKCAIKAPLTPNVCNEANADRVVDFISGKYLGIGDLSFKDIAYEPLNVQSFMKVGDNVKDFWPEREELGQNNEDKRQFDPATLFGDNDEVDGFDFD